MLKKMSSVTMCVLVLALLAAALPGCGDQDSASGRAALKKALASVSGQFVEIGERSKSWTFISGGALITSDSANLRGKLPPAQPVQLITLGNQDLKRVAITIDDGWNADMRILDLMKKLDVRFTAFLIGDRGVADAHPEFVKAIQDAGGEVCSHTLTHYVMKGKDEATFMNEIWKSNEIITSVTHEVYPYIRFSGGAYDENNLNWAAREGFWVVNWTQDSGDTANGATADREVSNILGGLKPGAIFLFHFGGHNTYEVLVRTIPEMQKQGYEVTSLTRVLEGTPFVLKPKEVEAGK